MPFPIDPIASDLYALDVYQIDLYVYTFDFWGLDPTVEFDTETQGDPAGNYIKLYENVPGYFESTPEYDEPTDIGLTQSINIFSLDMQHFNTAQPVQDGWFLKMTGAPNPALGLVGKWWAFQSNTQTHAYLAEKLRIYSKRIPNPPNGWAAPGQVL